MNQPFCPPQDTVHVQICCVFECAFILNSSNLPRHCLSFEQQLTIFKIPSSESLGEVLSRAIISSTSLYCIVIKTTKFPLVTD